MRRSALTAALLFWIVLAARGQTTQGSIPIRTHTTSISITSHLALKDRALPILVSPLRDGSVRLGWNDTGGSLHITPLSPELKRTGTDQLLKECRIRGLAGHADGSNVFLASTEEGPVEFRPKWISRGDNTLRLLKTDPDGKVVFRTHLHGGLGYGPQATWYWKNYPGVLAYSGQGYGAFYPIGKNFAKPGAPPNSHVGDAFIVIDRQGRIIRDHCRIWTASHSFDQQMVVNARGEFLTLAMGDAFPAGIVFHRYPNRIRKVLWPEREFMKKLLEGRRQYAPGILGGMTLLKGQCAAVFTTRLREGDLSSQNSTSYDAFFIRFDESGNLLAKVRLTREPVEGKIHAYIARFGGNLLVAWSDAKGERAVLGVIDKDGTFLRPPKPIKYPLSYGKGFENLPNGDVVWAVGSHLGRKIHLVRIKAPGPAARPSPKPVTPPLPPASRPTPKPRPTRPRVEDPEYDAAAALHIAKAFLNQGKQDLAVAKLKEIVGKYPQTDAGKKANEMLIEIQLANESE